MCMDWRTIFSLKESKMCFFFRPLNFHTAPSSPYNVTLQGVAFLQKKTYTFSLAPSVLLHEAKERQNKRPQNVQLRPTDRDP